MYPHERSLVKQLADKPFALIGVNSDGDLDEIREIVKEKNLTWRSFQDEQDDGQISSRWGIQGWPTVFVLDHEGRIRHRDIRGDAMDRAIEELLGEMGHEVQIAHEDEQPEKAKAKEKTDKEDSEKPKADDSDSDGEETKSSADEGANCAPCS